MPEELEEFLEQGVNMTLSCLKPNGDPYNTICWYEWRDGYFWIVVRQRSRWAEYLKNDPRVAFTVATWDPYVKMQAEGQAEVVEEPNLGGRWVEITRRMSYRYLGPNGPTYLESTMKQPRWLFRIKPENMKTWHGVGWARRYRPVPGPEPPEQQSAGRPVHAHSGPLYRDQHRGRCDLGSARRRPGFSSASMPQFDDRGRMLLLSDRRLWISETYGAAWQARLVAVPAGVRVLTLNSAVPGALFAIRVSSQPAASSLRAAGLRPTVLLKSRDSGAHWEQLALLAPAG